MAAVNPMYPPVVHPSITLLGPLHPQRRSALRLILAGAPDAAPESDARVQRLEELATFQGLSMDLLMLLECGYGGATACLALEAPGGAAMVHVASTLAGAEAHYPSVTLLRAAQVQVWERGAAMLQSLIPTDAAGLASAHAAAGFRQVAELVYLTVPAAQSPPRCSGVDPLLSWVTYTAGTQALFARALEDSYVETLDCPALTGLRSTADVLAGHRATGLHDPALWFVAYGEDRPVGVLLLSPVGEQALLEVVYMGVAWHSRRRGIANVLLTKAVCEAITRGFAGLTLAVDAANTPALRLYQRWGFDEFARRSAWLAQRPA